MAAILEVLAFLASAAIALHVVIHFVSHWCGRPATSPPLAVITLHLLAILLCLGFAVSVGSPVFIVYFAANAVWSAGATWDALRSRYA